MPPSRPRPVPAAANGASRVHAAASGTIRIAAEEELTCADWIASCAGSSWGNWIFGNLTLPQAFPVNSDGGYTPGDILTGAPVLDAGPPMKVTYHIKPEANWSDGQPITSKDFEYTWKQIVTGKDIYDSTGYEDISEVDTTDPKTAVVTFKQPYAAWRDLFGGFYFVLPSHLLDGKNRHKLMKDGYAFSGGPWQLEGGKSGWKKGKTLTLVPEPELLGHEAVDRQGRVPVRARERGRARRREDRPGGSPRTRSPRPARSTRSTRRATSRTASTPATSSRRSGTTPRRSRSTAWPCASRSATRSTARRS